jgi:signal transduction histidine kinase
MSFFITKKKTLQIIFVMICSVCYSQNSKLDSAYFLYEKAVEFNKINKPFLAFENYSKAKTLYTYSNELDSIAKCNIALFDLLQTQNNLNYDSKKYLDEYYIYALSKKDSFMLLTSYFSFAQLYFNPEEKEISSKYYRKAIKLTKDKNSKATAYANLALLYTKTSPDSASFFFKKTLNIYTKEDKNQLFSTYVNYANFHQQQYDFKSAILQLKKAEVIEPTEYKLNYYKILYGKFANCYKGLGNYKKAYEYYEKYNIIRDSLNNTAQNIAISDLDKKYKTAEKDKKIIETEARRVKNRNFLIGALLFILLSGTIGLLSLKNSKRKRKLAEQEKEIETQKNLTLLKEQELTTINAMVNGQEKERKRIAEDLHDNLGSVLATLKLHFENLQINSEKKKLNQDVLFSKTGNLIDEAYLKVRSIAHAKNAGVIANQGLLIAVKMMAEKISSADKINIEVIDFGLDKRLENSLEISVFRIIQELITNIIKHADANNVAINLALYDHNLNIIVEDDGKGFDVLKVNFKNGMGINSIKTRIEHIGGNLEIDSTLKKGTTIIINIPVE